MTVIKTAYYVLGPSPLEKGTWVIYHPYSLSFIEVVHELGEKLLEFKVYGTNKHDTDVRLFLEELLRLKPRNVMKVPPKPSVAYINVTSVCNLNCSYCYAKSGSYGFLEPVKELDDTVIQGITRVIEELEIRKVVFFGGEPLVGVNSISKLLKKLDNYNVEFTIITNGTLINNEIVDIIKTYRIRVNISLDGWRMVHDIHRRFANGRGSYDKVIDGIRKLQEERIPIFIQATYSYPFVELGITFTDVALYLSHITKRFTIRPAQPVTSETMYILYGEYMIESLNQLTETNSRYIEEDVLNLTIALINRIFKPFSCDFFDFLTILPNGDIYSCHVFPPLGKIGNVITSNTNEILIDYKKLLVKILPEIISMNLNEFLMSDCYPYRMQTKKFNKILDLISKMFLMEFYKIIKENKINNIVNNISKLIQLWEFS